MNTQPLSGRPFYWLVRRELWENRSIYIAPLIAAAVYLLGVFISLTRLPHNMRELGSLSQEQQFSVIVMPYSHAAMLLMLVAFIVAVFYCLDALYGERRDRSILFWKSLPVSDGSTVLSKAVIPLVILPLLVFALSLLVQAIMLLTSGLVLALSGVNAGELWTRVPLLQMQVSLLYGLAALTLWHAPIYGWLLMVSAWARRAALLWALLPPLAIGIFEKVAFRTTYFASLLQYGLLGWFQRAFTPGPGNVPVDPHLIPLKQLAPAYFFTTPSLWIGLALAGVFLAAAARLRRTRGPN